MSSEEGTAALQSLHDWTRSTSKASAQAKSVDLARYMGDDWEPSPFRVLQGGVTEWRAGARRCVVCVEYRSGNFWSAIAELKSLPICALCSLARDPREAARRLDAKLSNLVAELNANHLIAASCPKDQEPA
jgi:hypothetical protein